MEIAPTSGEKDRSVSSFLKIADLDRLGTRFLEATNWNHEEAQELCFSGAGVGGHDLPSSSSSLVVSMTGWGESAGVDDDRDLMSLGDTDDDHIAPLPTRREVPYKSADKEEADSTDDSHVSARSSIAATGWGEVDEVQRESPIVPSGWGEADDDVDGGNPLPWSSIAPTGWGEADDNVDGRDPLPWSSIAPTGWGQADDDVDGRDPLPRSYSDPTGWGEADDDVDGCDTLPRSYSDPTGWGEIDDDVYDRDPFPWSSGWGEAEDGPDLDDDYVPPLPVKRERLYDYVDDEEDNLTTTLDNSSGLGSFASAPLPLMFRGTFHDAKEAASRENRWLLVNVQSAQEFTSHLVNQNTWSEETLASVIKDKFLFWQVDDGTNKGKKVCTFYKLESLPAIMVIDPVTGQKMRAWSGMVEAVDLLPELLPYTKAGPKEYVFAPRKRRQFESDTEGQQEQNLSSASEDNENKEKDDSVEILCQKLEYLHLPEEPKESDELICRVGVRLPDGRRLQRKFLQSDTVKLLWSFCSSQLDGDETRRFYFVLAAPGSHQRFDYESDLTFKEAGVSNTLLMLLWIESLE